MCMYVCDFVGVCVLRGYVCMSVSSWVYVCMGPRCVCMFVIVWWEGWPGELLALGMGQKCACMSVISWVCSCGEEGGGVGGSRSGRCFSFFFKSFLKKRGSLSWEEPCMMWHIYICLCMYLYIRLFVMYMHEIL